MSHQHSSSSSSSHDFVIARVAADGGSHCGHRLLNVLDVIVRQSRQRRRFELVSRRSVASDRLRVVEGRFVLILHEAAHRPSHGGRNERPRVLRRQLEVVQLLFAVVVVGAANTVHGHRLLVELVLDVVGGAVAVAPLLDHKPEPPASDIDHDNEDNHEERSQNDSNHFFQLQGKVFSSAGRLAQDV